MIKHNIDVFIGRNKPEEKAVVKCHDTGVCLRVFFKTERKASKWRTTEEAYTIPSGAAAVIKIEKPDKKYVLQDGTCQGSSALFKLPPQSFTVAGKAKAEVNIFGADGRRITSDTFYIEVPKEVAGDCAEDSDTYVDVMAQQIQAAIDAAERAEEAAERAEETGGGGGTGGDGSGIFKEIDPTVPDWAKQPKKPTYTAKEVGALPDDAVSDWAKQPQKPTYTADEVGAMPGDTVIPMKYIEANDPENPVYLAALDSGVYVLNGDYIRPYPGAEEEYQFANVMTHVVNLVEEVHVFAQLASKGAVYAIQVNIKNGECSMEYTEVDLAGLQAWKDSVVEEITEEADHDHYPTAQAVKGYVDAALGEVDTALDSIAAEQAAIIAQQKSILAMQNALIGGDGE